MYKIFAIIVFSMNGNPIDEPQKLPAHITFASEAECRSFQSSERNEKGLAALKELVKALLKPGIEVTIGNTCELAKDDGSI